MPTFLGGRKEKKEKNAIDSLAKQRGRGSFLKRKGGEENRRDSFFRWGERTQIFSFIIRMEASLFSYPFRGKTSFIFIEREKKKARNIRPRDRVGWGKQYSRQRSFFHGGEEEKKRQVVFVCKRKGKRGGRAVMSWGKGGKGGSACAVAPTLEEGRRRQL